MLCPLCRTRKARRACPALGQQICAVCCGTKRLVEIHCPPDCTYLATAREHPPAAVVRRQKSDLAAFLHVIRDLNERQARLFFAVGEFLIRYEAPELQPLIDGDVAEAVGALAATLETSARGVIYEHQPASVAASRLLAGLKSIVSKTGAEASSVFERDAAVVLRRVEEAAKGARGEDAGNRRAFLDLVARVLRTAEESDTKPEADQPEAPRLILP